MNVCIYWLKRTIQTNRTTLIGTHKAIWATSCNRTKGAAVMGRPTPFLRKQELILEFCFLICHNSQT
ncbi:hypothetical protein HanRHA438_Chr12g0571071 [Helianthus annuus]|nr:hypothetical protein HanRHA438_Chr12g0571071 [Helianthus annuus]